MGRFLFIVLVLFSSITFCVPWAYLPFASWVPETSALIFSALIVLAVVWQTRKSAEPFSLDPFALACLALAVVLVVEYFIHSPPYMSNYFVATAYCCMAALIGFGIQRAAVNKFDVLTPIAWGLFVGMIGQCLFACVQVGGGLAVYDKWAAGKSLWIPHMNPRAEATGLIFQKNQLADYIVLGNLAGAFLVTTGKLRLRWFLLWLPLVTLVLSLTSSRAVWLTLFTVSAFTIWNWRNKDKMLNTYSRTLGYFCVSALLLQLIHPLIEPAMKALFPWMEAGSSLERLREQGLGFRFWLWKQAIWTFLDNPIFGNGSGGFGPARVFLQTRLPDHDYHNTEFFNHTHNMFMQLLSENGLLGFIVVLLGLLVGLFFFWRKPATVYRNFVGLALAIVLIRSQLEYPLWYSHFFMLFMALYASQNVAAISWRGFKNLTQISAAILSILVISGSFWSLYSYTRLIWVANRGEPTVSVEERKTILDLCGDPFMGGMADIFNLLRLQSPGDDNLADKLALTDRLLQYRPVEFVLFRRALYMTYAGDTVTALKLMEISSTAFSDTVDNFKVWFRGLERDPRLVPLIQKLLQIEKANH